MPVTLAFVLVGCGGAQEGGGDCQGYPCTAEGAKAMLRATLTRSNKSLRGAEREVDKLIEGAARRMGERGYTPANFAIAARNMRKLIESSPHGAEATVARELERVNRATHWLCPLWPFC